MSTIPELVMALSNLAGPSGEEDRVQDFLAARWTAAEVAVERTRVGNLVGRVGGSGPRLALVAHADEIGLVVKSITADGLSHIWPASPDHKGRPPFWHSPVNNPVRLLADHGDVDGQLVYASGHVQGGSSKQGFDWNDWFVDVGATDGTQLSELGIHPGTRIVAGTQARQMHDTVVGKAMDDRALLAIMTHLLESIDRERLRFELWVASTIQEENSMIGASSLVDLIDLDACIALDVGLCGDLPGVDAADFPGKLRNGPMVVYQDGAVHYSTRMSRDLVAAASRDNLPYQQAVFQYYSTDGAELIRRGVETALVTLPTRYTHTPNEMVATTDLEATTDLLSTYLTR